MPKQIQGRGSEEVFHHSDRGDFNRACSANYFNRFTLLMKRLRGTTPDFFKEVLPGCNRLLQDYGGVCFLFEFCIFCVLSVSSA